MTNAAKSKSKTPRWENGRARIVDSTDLEVRVFKQRLDKMIRRLICVS